MPRSGLSYTAVKEAAERLREQGIAPTVMRVRTEVGGTGSLTTIAKHLKEWRLVAEPDGAQGLTGPLAPLGGLPSQVHVPAHVAQLAAQAWRQLSEVASQEIEQAQAACTTELEQAREALASELAEARTQATSEVAAAEQAREVAEGRLAELRTAAERAQKEHEQLAAKMSHLAAELARLTGEREAERAATAAREHDLRERLGRLEVKCQQAVEARDTALTRQRSSEAQCQARLDKQAHIEQQRLLGIGAAFERTLAGLRADAEARSAAEQSRHEAHVQALGHIDRVLGQLTERAAHASAQARQAEEAQAGLRREQQQQLAQLERMHEAIGEWQQLKEPLLATSKHLAYVAEVWQQRSQEPQKRS